MSGCKRLLEGLRYQRTSHAAFFGRTLLPLMLLVAAAKGEVAFTSKTSKYSSVISKSSGVGDQVVAVRAAVTAGAASDE